MSRQLTDRAWLKPLPAREKLVLLALASLSTDDGVSWPSQATLMDRTGLSRSSVARALTHLEGRRLLRRRGEPGFVPEHTLIVEEAA